MMEGSALEDVCGVLNVDKPPGLTSHDVVATIRRMVRQRRVGHAGTLDPMATGVLLVCLGQATRVSEYLMRSNKTYRGSVHLGVSTTTDDIEGEIVETKPVMADRAEIEAALSQFVGHIQQIPPRYSAIKVRGRRLYELARQGIEVEVPPREVDVYAVQLLAWQPPVAEIRVQCGPGTYIRALARDLGQALGCGGHLVGLRRLSSGPFDASEGVKLEHLEMAVLGGQLERYLHPLDVAFYDLPALYADDQEAYRLATGQYVQGDIQGEEGAWARAYVPDGRFVALVSWDRESGAWRPRKVFLAPESLAPA
jgi:tRNA pseudouridine55 synthase